MSEITQHKISLDQTPELAAAFDGLSGPRKGLVATMISIAQIQHFLDDPRTYARMGPELHNAIAASIKNLAQMSVTAIIEATDMQESEFDALQARADAGVASLLDVVAAAQESVASQAEGNHVQ